jgi:alpha-methylacyl-CoA racemase
MRHALSEKFRQHARDHWGRVFADGDACVTPVLTITEAMDDPQLQSRNVFVDVDGVRQPAPAPLFSRTPAPPPAPAHTDSVKPTWRPPSR